MIRSAMWILRMKTCTFCIHMLIISQYIVCRMVDRCYIIFIGSRSDLSSAMASRWRMEAVQQRTSLLVHMSHRNGPNTQLCRIYREKYLQYMKNIFATPAPQLKLQCFHLRVCKSYYQKTNPFPVFCREIFVYC